MKCRRCKNSSQVILNDVDLLTLILLHVPYIELLSLKSVSKKWLSVITSPHFTRLLRDSLPPLRASGLFIQRPPDADVPDKVYFVPLDNPNVPSPFRNLDFFHDPFDPEKVRILESCNGLLLCSTALYRSYEERNCYVYNPFTNQLDTLPRLTSGTCIWIRYVGLTFDPSKSIHYKVIAFVFTSLLGPLFRYVGDFHIYSSETGIWKASVRSFMPVPTANFIGSAYWNGCLHWLSRFKSESEQESTAVSDCLYFNVDEERLATFPRPPISVISASKTSSLFFEESEGHLHFIEVCPNATSLSVHEMKSDYSGWFVKYQIDLDPISKVFPEMNKHKGINNYSVAALSLIRRENFREDSYLVLEIPGKVIRYNLMNRSVKVIWNFSVENIDHCSCGYLQASQYIKSV